MVTLVRLSEIWWVMTDSNCRPSPCKGDALPTELITRLKTKIFYFNRFSHTAARRRLKYWGRVAYAPDPIFLKNNHLG